MSNQSDSDLPLELRPPSLEDLELVPTKTLLDNKPVSSGFLVMTIFIFVCGLISSPVVANWFGFTSGQWLELFSAQSESFNLRQAFLRSSDMNLLVRDLYKLWTSILLHADFGHWLSNALGLFFFGGMLINYYGLSWTLFAILFGGGLVQFLTLANYQKNVNLLGASGVVYLLGALWLVLYVCTYRTKRLTARVLRVIGVSLVVLAPTEFKQNTSYSAHLIGYLTGIVLGLIFFYLFRAKIRSYEEYALQEKPLPQ